MERGKFRGGKLGEAARERIREIDARLADLLDELATVEAAFAAEKGLETLMDAEGGAGSYEEYMALYDELEATDAAKRISAERIALGEERDRIFFGRRAA